MSGLLILKVIERSAALVQVALEAAKRGDAKAVDELLPDPEAYPADSAFQQYRDAAELDYGPRPT